jgi:hypothetical protein
VLAAFDRINMFTTGNAQLVFIFYTWMGDYYLGVQRAPFSGLFYNLPFKSFLPTPTAQNSAAYQASTTRTLLGAVALNSVLLLFGSDNNANYYVFQSSALPDAVGDPNDYANFGLRDQINAMMAALTEVQPLQITNTHAAPNLADRATVFKRIGFEVNRVVARNRVLIMAGQIGTSAQPGAVTNDVFASDDNGASWWRLATPPWAPRTYAASAATRNAVFIAGGFATTLDYTSSTPQPLLTDCYASTDGGVAWFALANTPQMYGISRSSMAIIGNTLLLAATPESFAYVDASAILDPNQQLAGQPATPLTALWRFDDTRLGYKGLDSTPNANTLSISQYAYVDSLPANVKRGAGALFIARDGGYLAMDGFALPVNGMSDVLGTASGSPARDFTFAAWVNLNSTAPGALASFGTFYAGANGAQQSANVVDLATNGVYDCNGKLALSMPPLGNTWTHVAFAYSVAGGTFTVYIDGDLLTRQLVTLNCAAPRVVQRLAGRGCAVARVEL